MRDNTEVVKCKYCGKNIHYNGVCWVDSGVVFPQYCSSDEACDQYHIPNTCICSETIDTYPTEEPYCPVHGGFNPPE